MLVLWCAITLFIVFVSSFLEENSSACLSVHLSIYLSCPKEMPEFLYSACSVFMITWELLVLYCFQVVFFDSASQRNGDWQRIEEIKQAFYWQSFSSTRLAFSSSAQHTEAENKCPLQTLKNHIKNCRTTYESLVGFFCNTSFENVHDAMGRKQLCDLRSGYRGSWDSDLQHWSFQEFVSSSLVLIHLASQKQLD